DKHMNGIEFHIISFILSYLIKINLNLNLQHNKIPLRIEQELFIKLCLFYGELTYLSNQNNNQLNDNI
ncbi:unnamed protein product, partial [Rotaria sp. Silwood2]